MSEEYRQFMQEFGLQSISEEEQFLFTIRKELQQMKKWREQLIEKDKIIYNLKQKISLLEHGLAESSRQRVEIQQMMNERIIALEQQLGSKEFVEREYQIKVEEYEGLQHDKDEMLEEWMKDKAELETVKEAHHHLQQAHHSLQEQWQATTSRQSQTQTLFETLRTELLHKQQEIDGLKQQAKQQQQQHEAECNHITGQYDLVQREIAILHEQQKKQERRYQQLQKEYQTINQTKHTIDVDYQQLQTTLRTREMEFSHLQSRCTQLQQELTRWQEKYEELKEKSTRHQHLHHEQMTTKEQEQQKLMQQYQHLLQEQQRGKDDQQYLHKMMSLCVQEIQEICQLSARNHFATSPKKSTTASPSFLPTFTSSSSKRQFPVTEERMPDVSAEEDYDDHYLTKVQQHIKALTQHIYELDHALPSSSTTSSASSSPTSASASILGHDFFRVMKYLLHILTQFIEAKAFVMRTGHVIHDFYVTNRAFFSAYPGPTISTTYEMNQEPGQEMNSRLPTSLNASLLEVENGLLMMLQDHQKTEELLQKLLRVVDKVDHPIDSTSMPGMEETGLSLENQSQRKLPREEMDWEMELQLLIKQTALFKSKNHEVLFSQLFNKILISLRSLYEITRPGGLFDQYELTNKDMDHYRQQTEQQLTNFQQQYDDLMIQHKLQEVEWEQKSENLKQQYEQQIFEQNLRLQKQQKESEIAYVQLEQKCQQMMYCVVLLCFYVEECGQKQETLRTVYGIRKQLDRGYQILRKDVQSLASICISSHFFGGNERNPGQVETATGIIEHEDSYTKEYIQSTFANANKIRYSFRSVAIAILAMNRLVWLGKNASRHVSDSHSSPRSTPPVSSCPPLTSFSLTDWELPSTQELQFYTPRQLYRYLQTFFTQKQYLSSFRVADKPKSPRSLHQPTYPINQSKSLLALLSYTPDRLRDAHFRFVKATQRKELFCQKELNILHTTLLEWRTEKLRMNKQVEDFHSQIQAYVDRLKESEDRLRRCEQEKIQLSLELNRAQARSYLTPSATASRPSHATTGGFSASSRSPSVMKRSASSSVSASRGRNLGLENGEPMDLEGITADSLLPHPDHQRVYHVSKQLQRVEKSSAYDASPWQHEEQHPRGSSEVESVTGEAIEKLSSLSSSRPHSANSSSYSRSHGHRNDTAVRTSLAQLRQQTFVTTLDTTQTTRMTSYPDEEEPAERTLRTREPLDRFDQYVRSGTDPQDDDDVDNETNNRLFTSSLASQPFASTPTSVAKPTPHSPRLPYPPYPRPVSAEEVDTSVLHSQEQLNRVGDHRASSPSFRVAMASFSGPPPPPQRSQTPNPTTPTTKYVSPEGSSNKSFDSISSRFLRIHTEEKKQHDHQDQELVEIYSDITRLTGQLESRLRHHTPTRRGVSPHAKSA